MPLYEYRCTTCSNQFEELRNMGDHVGCCPECGGRVELVFGMFQFKFRSSGWKPYTVDDTGEETVKEEIHSV